MLERGFEVGSDVGSNDFGGWQIGTFLQGFVLEPEDVQVHLVAFGEFFVGEGFEAFALLAVNAVRRVVAGDEVVEVASA